MSTYQIPSWAGNPPIGLHLDVTKDGKLIQKLMIDEKGCYLFGRNSQLNDFTVDHSSCSRIHAALVYHKHLGRFFLVDCGSTHGTYIGNLRLESHKPTQLPIDRMFRFGASTRSYKIRERPQTGNHPKMAESEPSSNKHCSLLEDGSCTNNHLLGLPETEVELDNLTEFNTAHNRQITVIGLSDSDGLGGTKKRRDTKISFKEEEQIINPEDIDPTVGKYRNMIETTFIPKKKPYYLNNNFEALNRRPDNPKSNKHNIAMDSKPRYEVILSKKYIPTEGLYDGVEAVSQQSGPSLCASSLSTKLGFSLPNPAPNMELTTCISGSSKVDIPEFEDSHAPLKKKYPTEAWPGKKHPKLQAKSVN